MALLETRGLTKNFGGLRAVSDVSFSVERGSITSLIGPNGAGKTTIFNLLTGFLKPTAGEVIYKGRSITDYGPDKICRAGMARTFQLVRIFPMLTVLDNVMLGFSRTAGEKILGAFFRTPRVRKEESESYDKAMELIRFVGLEAQIHQYAINLGYGQQKLVELSRALATDAELLLLDEPMAGLSGELREKMIGLLRDLPHKGKTVFLIEHNMHVVMGISERIFVLNFGELIASGSPSGIRNNEQVIEAYLGREE